VSYVKRFVEDQAEVTARAADIAWMPDECARLAALTGLFRDIGTMANIYAVPELAARELVKVTVEAYQGERAVLRGVELAGAVS
jgi:hypothetical protein